jgi:uncharacterized membrane protein
MRALAAERPACGMAAMQSINRKVYGSLFLVLFLVMAALAVGLGGYALTAAPPAVSSWLLAGSVAYLFGVFVVTLLCNVPMNKVLDGVPGESPEAARYWVGYLKLWTRWNHVRTLASVIAAICFLIAGLMSTQS